MGQYDRVSWRYARMTRRQRQALIATEKAIQKRYPNFEFQVPQGSWRPQTEYSGTSHTGAGAVDLQYSGLYGEVGYSTKAEKEKYRFVLRMLKAVGNQAAFGRGPWDDMILHFHVLDLDTTGMASSSKYFQVPQFRLGNNGLSAGVKDRFQWRPDPIRRWRYKR